jgi:nickel/cobalt exporter
VPALFLCSCFQVISAHPLGNFSINHFARLEIGLETIRVRYVIDIAEIPTFQELQTITSSGSPSKTELDAYLQRQAANYPDGLELLVDGTRIPLKIKATNLVLRPGAGGMQTMRIECDLAGPLGGNNPVAHRLTFADNNYRERIGWREIVILTTPAVSVFNSSAYAGAVTNELQSYPADMLAAPLDERRAELSFTTGVIPSGASILRTRDGRPAAIASRDRFTELIAVPQLTPGVALVGLLMAWLLGSLHAMSPGHGKTVVAAYLIGSRGTARHAGFLGLTVTITHTAGVFALGIATLLASEYIVPEQLYPKLSFLSGLIVVGIGLSLLSRRLAILIGPAHDHAQMSHDHHHSHDHDHHHHDHEQSHSHGRGTHTHFPPGADGAVVTWRSLLALGISGGILPCPSALVVLLAAISLHRVGYGLLLVLAFSFGLACMLTAVGIAFVYAGRRIKTGGRFDWLTRVLPVGSALVIACAGVAICYAALNQAGYSISEIFSQLTARFTS